MILTIRKVWPRIHLCFLGTSNARPNCEFNPQPIAKHLPNIEALNQ